MTLIDEIKKENKLKLEWMHINNICLLSTCKKYMITFLNATSFEVRIFRNGNIIYENIYYSLTKAQEAAQEHFEENHCECKP